jgi:hypothetical protein
MANKGKGIFLVYVDIDAMPAQSMHSSEAARRNQQQLDRNIHRFAIAAAPAAHKTGRKPEAARPGTRTSPASFRP